MQKKSDRSPDGPGEPDDFRSLRPTDGEGVGRGDGVGTESPQPLARQSTAVFPVWSDIIQQNPRAAGQDGFIDARDAVCFADSLRESVIPLRNRQDSPDAPFPGTLLARYPRQARPRKRQCLATLVELHRALPV